MVEEDATSAGPAPAEPRRGAFAPYSLETLVSGAARLRPETIAFSDRTTAYPYGIIAAQVAALARMLTDYGSRPGECLLLVGGAELSLIIGRIPAVRGGFEPTLAPLDLNAEALAAYARTVRLGRDSGADRPWQHVTGRNYFATAAAAPSVRLVGTFQPGEVDGDSRSQLRGDPALCRRASGRGPRARQVFAARIAR